MNIDVETFELGSGPHKSIEAGACAMELVSYIADERFSAYPECACPVITAYVIRLNDRWDDKRRQKLKPLLSKIVGTRSTKAVEEKRRFLLIDFVCRVVAPMFLDAAGLADWADKLRAAEPVESQESSLAARDLAFEAKRAAYDRERLMSAKWRNEFRGHFDAEMKKRGVTLTRPLADYADAAVAGAADAAPAFADAAYEAAYIAGESGAAYGAAYIAGTTAAAAAVAAGAADDAAAAYAAADVYAVQSVVQARIKARLLEQWRGLIAKTDALALELLQELVEVRE